MACVITTIIHWNPCMCYGIHWLCSPDDLQEEINALMSVCLCNESDSLQTKKPM